MKDQIIKILKSQPNNTGHVAILNLFPNRKFARFVIGESPLNCFYTEDSVIADTINGKYSPEQCADLLIELHNSDKDIYWADRKSK